MKIEEYGRRNEKTIVMLHAANYVSTFACQYELAKDYHIIVPHLMGFGDNTEKSFQTEECVNQLAEYIAGLGKKVYLVGFSLGAQLGFKLVSEHQELFYAAILISPWLIKEEPLLSEIEAENMKQLKHFKNKLLCSLSAALNGMHTEQRKLFVSQMQNVTEESIHNIVYNGITLDSVPTFKDVSIPVAALAGGKEYKEVQDSVIAMAELNKNCKSKIFDKAGHNIPYAFARRLNAMIRRMCSNVNKNGTSDNR